MAFSHVPLRRRVGSNILQVTTLTTLKGCETMSRPSLELREPENVLAAKALQTQLKNANLQLVNKVSELNAHRVDDDDGGSDSEGRSHKDPAIVALEVADQIVRPQHGEWLKL